MTALDTLAFDPQPHEHVTAEAFDKSEAFGGVAGKGGAGGGNRPVRQTLQDLLDELEALLDLADAHPDTRIDVALVEDGYLEIKMGVGRINRPLASIECAGTRTRD